MENDTDLSISTKPIAVLRGLYARGLRRRVRGAGAEQKSQRKPDTLLYLDQEEFGLQDIQTASTFVDISRVFPVSDTKFTYSTKRLVNHCQGEPESERGETGPRFPRPQTKEALP